VTMHVNRAEVIHERHPATVDNRRTAASVSSPEDLSRLAAVSATCPGRSAASG
jgi:hypothetical protein